MSFSRMDGKLRAAAVLAFIMICADVHLASAQAGKPTAGPTVGTKPHSAAGSEEARLRQFIDKNGGYKDKRGGYYDPNAGTYTDEVGGVVDNWQGYTYNNGDYKAKTGDFWQAATKTFKLANGEVMKSAETSNKDAIAVLRETVEENGGFDKDFMRKSMLAAITKEHPASASGSLPQTAAEEARLMKFVDAKGGYRDRDGGYFDPRSGTYTDKLGGVVDNWQGYTYKDGSYKSKLGDYWDAPSKTVKFAGGGERKSPQTSNADAITVLRQSVEENGGFNKDFIKNGMLGTIQREHPLGVVDPR